MKFLERIFISNMHLLDRIHELKNTGPDLTGIKLAIGNNRLTVNEKYINLEENKDFIVST